jgi:hypothetical protein
MTHRVLSAIRGNIVAWVALFVALGGTSIAAQHYLITSTSQIKPSVLRKLEQLAAADVRGPRGATGSQGTAGAKGETGSRGLEGKEGLTGHEGPAGPEGVTGLSAEELSTLAAVLPYIRYISSGIGGKPTIQFSGLNLQVVSGGGKTEETNGAGNLVLGYDESPGTQTGSNDLIVGDEHSYTSYGAIIGGKRNSVSAPFGVAFGDGNEVQGSFSTVSGGEGNIASGRDSSVFGGESNTASGNYAAVSGGAYNVAASATSAVSGGVGNEAGGEGAAVSGGAENKATGNYSSVFGGNLEEATGEFETKP